MSTYPNAHAKVQNLIFEVQFLGNWSEFGIIVYDFVSSRNSSRLSELLGFKFHVLSSKILKIPRFNLFICQPSEFFSVRIPDSGEPVIQKNRWSLKTGGLTFIEDSSSGLQLFGITYSSISLKKLFRWISIVHSLQSSILKTFELQKSLTLSDLVFFMKTKKYTVSLTLLYS